MKTADSFRRFTVNVEVFYSASPSGYHPDMPFFDETEIVVPWFHRTDVMCQFMSGKTSELRLSD